MYFEIDIYIILYIFVLLFLIKTIVVGIWYANPQRLDVYSNDAYILPNNAEYDSNNRLTWRRPQTPLQFRPTVASTINGENYFDRDRQTLYLVVRGSNIVEIKTTPAVILTFGVPSIAVDEFFEENLRSNLAQLLNISPENIRVVNIIREDSRRRRRAAGDTAVEIEIVAGNATSASSKHIDSQTCIERPPRHVLNGYLDILLLT